MNTITTAGAAAARPSSSGPFLKRGIAPALVFFASLLPVLIQFALHSYSSGHDLPFHLGSWQDAAYQLHHGVYPQWDFSAALGSGEPRFIFYPPLSWLLGAVLSGFLTPAHASESFILIALAASWLTMFGTARRYTTEAAATIAAAVYTAGPYTLYNALERAAYGELLACAWLPLLFAAGVPAENDSLLPELRRIAIPLALLWLTNVPTAIIGSYLLLLLTALRMFRHRRELAPAGVAMLALRTTAGATLGLWLCAFFLIPALHQSRFVQLNSAFTEGQKYSDNFLLHHTVNTRRGNIHVVSVIAAEYFVSLVVLLIILYVRGRNRPRRASLLPALFLGTVAALFLMLPISSLVWKYVPDLSVLQFPWRLLSVLSLLASMALALSVAPRLRGHITSLVMAVFLATTLGVLGAHRYWLNPNRVEVDGRFRSDDASDEQYRPTVEYTPTGAANAALRDGQPTYWLAADVKDDAEGTMAFLDGDTRFPLHFALSLRQPEFLVLKVRDYPSWTVIVNGRATPSTPRPDGRIAVALPAGMDIIELRWRTGLDVRLGEILSIGAAALLFSWAPKRKNPVMKLHSLSTHCVDTTYLRT